VEPPPGEPWLCLLFAFPGIKASSIEDFSPAQNRDEVRNELLETMRICLKPAIAVFTR